MPFPLASLAPPISSHGTIGRRFPAGLLSEPVHGFAAAGERRAGFSAFANNMVSFALI